MSFASAYLSKHQYFGRFISDKPLAGTGIIVVIPCYNEPSVIRTLESLKNCNQPSVPVEVIVTVNCSDSSPEEVIIRNRETVAEVVAWSRVNSSDRIRFYVIEPPPFPPAHGGVGFARKTGMDEAVARFNYTGNSDGIVVSFDADSTCDPNYLEEIEKCFKDQHRTGCTIYFEHPLSGAETHDVYKAIAEYELYLRYFVQSMRFTGFPYSFHTVGSCFAVNASVYASQGGMNRKKAAEDFYFLNKIFPLGRFTELNTTRVIPASRVSDRVPFGTGAAITDYTTGKTECIKGYHPDSFLELRALFSNLETLYKAEAKHIELFVSGLPEMLGRFLTQAGFTEKLIEINSNSSSYDAFKGRFYRWFNSLRLLQFLNFASKNGRANLPVNMVAEEFLIKMDLACGSSVKELLFKFRDLQRKEIWQT